MVFNFAIEMHAFDFLLTSRLEEQNFIQETNDLVSNTSSYKNLN